jgi:hypothetical protein
MINAIIYFIDSIVIGIFCYKVYSFGNKKMGNNSFINHFFWVSLFITIAFLKSAIIIPISLYLPENDLLFWTDFIGRGLFYIVAAFSVRIPLYEFFPKSSKTIIWSYAFIVIGILLLIYQFINRNEPTINSVGIINWNADIILSMGMAALLVIPWSVTSIIFIRDFIHSGFGRIRPLLLGSGFLAASIGTVFQDSSTTVFNYIFFGLFLVIGFALMLVGMFYEQKKLHYFG